jgi:NAD(P)H-hydrate epimerase
LAVISEWSGLLPALTTDQMREVDRRMIDEMGITLLQMMENAGRHLATLARERLGGTVEGKRVVVLAGRGNNGGGGIVAARRLANWDAAASVILVAPPENYRGIPAHQLAILRRMGVPILERALPLPNADLILDALIGYGLRAAPRGSTADLIRAANASGVGIIALDAPSGLDTTTGVTHDPTIRAEATLTLAFPKVGLLMDSARAVVGELYVADIGVPPRVYAAMGLGVPNIFREAEIVHLDDRQGHP